MKPPSRTHTSKRFALLITFTGFLVVVLTFALAEMTASAHKERSGNDCIIRCNKPHDTSMDGLSCTQCRQFPDNGLVQGRQTSTSGEWETRYTPIFTGAGFLLGELPAQMTSPKLVHGDFGDGVGKDHIGQPVASEATGIPDQPACLPARGCSVETTSLKALP